MGNAPRNQSLLIVLVPHSVLVVYGAVELVDDDWGWEYLLGFDDWLGDHVHVVPVLRILHEGLGPVTGGHGGRFEILRL